MRVIISRAYFYVGTYIHGTLISRDKLIFILESYIHAGEITAFCTGTYMHGALISRGKLIFMLEPIFMGL